MTVADTSRLAFESHRSTGALTQQQRKVLAHMAHECHRDWSRAELAEATGISLQAICGRANELVKLGLLHEPKTRKCGVTGRSVHALALVPSQQDLDLAAA